MQLARAGNVPQKAGYAEAHVLGVAKHGEQHSRNADYCAGDNDQPVYLFHMRISYNKIKFHSAYMPR